MIHYSFELYGIVHYQWQSIDGKNDKFHSTENIEWHCMQIESNRNSIKEKWDVNWWRIEIYSWLWCWKEKKKINKK
jgi:hypothetical protein